jgi:hypothetical protein
VVASTAHAAEEHVELSGAAQAAFPDFGFGCPTAARATKDEHQPGLFRKSGLFVIDSRDSADMQMTFTQYLVPARTHPAPPECRLDDSPSHRRARCSEKRIVMG